MQQSLRFMLHHCDGSMARLRRAIHHVIRIQGCDPPRQMLQHTGFADAWWATQQNQFRQAFDLSMAQSALLLKPTSTESNQTETRTQYDTEPPKTRQLRDLEITRPTQVNTITTALGN